MNREICVPYKYDANKKEFRINLTRLEDCGIMALREKDEYEKKEYKNYFKDVFKYGKEKLKENWKIVLLRRYQNEREDFIKAEYTNIKDFEDYEKKLLELYKIN